MTERQAIEATYWDKYDVYRRENFKDPETRQTRQSERLLFQSLDCAVSRSKSGEHSIVDSRGVVRSSYTLFCAPETPIVPGDRIVVHTAAGQELSLWAGEPFFYSSHAEIPLSAEAPA